MRGIKNIAFMLISIIVFVGLIGCSNTTSSSEGSQSSSSKETSKIFENKEVKEIRVISNTSNLSKGNTDNKDFINQIITAIKSGSSKEITLDEKTRKSAKSNIEVIFTDDSTEKLLLWINDDKFVIAKDTNDKEKVQGIQIDSSTSKMVTNFLKTSTK